jgi:Ras homolog gene family, member A
MGAAYIECSSKEMTGVDEVFQLAVNTVVGVEEQEFYGAGTGPTGKSGSGGRKVKKRTCKIL